MAVLSQEEAMKVIKALIGDKTDDESLKTLEDMKDTLAERKSADGIDWKAKHDALDAEWRKRYRDRFFSGSDGTDRAKNENNVAPKNEEPESKDNTPKVSLGNGEEKNADEVTYDDLFIEPQKKE